MKVQWNQQDQIGEQEFRVKILIIHQTCMRTNKDKNDIQVLDFKLIQHFSMEPVGEQKRISTLTKSGHSIGTYSIKISHSIRLILRLPMVN
jgi:hypothetical protein